MQEVHEEEEEEESKGKKPALTTPSGSGGGAPVEHNSGPRLESEKAKENKASVGGASSTVEGGRSEVMPSAVSEGGAESDDALGKGFREAVDGENFEWLKENWVSWRKRRDLLDYVIAKGVDVTVWFIQSVESAKRVYLLHSLIREKG